MEEVTIRDYSESDRKGFMELYASVFREPPWNEQWSAEQIADELKLYSAKRDLSFLVAEARGEIIGFSVAYTVAMADFPFLGDEILRRGSDPASGSFRMAYGDELAVDKRFRGKGIATAMVEARVAAYGELYGRESATDAFIIGRTDVGSMMVPLYRKLGYEDTGIRDPEYPSRTYFIKPLRRE